MKGGIRHLRKIGRANGEGRQLERPSDRALLGHPRGLAVLCLSECWERFSYAGMQALLVLYTTHWLFQPGRIEHVWGFARLRAVVEFAYGPLGTQALASAIFGLYAGLIYLTPILGGVLADRVIGKTRTIVIGALLLMLGHWLMGYEESFVLALAALVLGVGLFKTNITSQVGDLYAIDDPRRASAFQIFVLFIVFAAAVAPLVCGTLGERYGWSWGFGAAGIGMGVGLATYLAGRRWLPADPPRRRGGGVVLPPLTRRERATVGLLVLLLPVLALAAVGNEQMFNAYLLWGEANYRLVVAGRLMPTSWLLSIDAGVAIVAMLVSIGFWRWWSRRRAEPDEITKLTIGAFICTLAPLLLAGLSVWSAGGHKLSLGWALLFHFVNELGFANLYPVGIALYSRCAPRALSGTMVAVFYLHMFASNLLIGWLGGLLPTMSGARFWGLHAALVGGAAVLLLLARRFGGELLAPSRRVNTVSM